MGSAFILRMARHKGTDFMKHFFQYFILISSFGVMMSGCNYGIFNTEPFADAHYDDKGNVVLEDTSGNWEFYMFSVDSEIVREVAGKAPDAGMKSWNDYWLFRMQAISENRESREKYVSYISVRRRQEGLPELVNQAEQK